MDGVLRNTTNEHQTDDDQLFEDNLSGRFPADYSRLVDGDPWNFIAEDGRRVIIVKDYDITTRYIYEDGHLKPLQEKVF